MLNKYSQNAFYCLVTYVMLFFAQQDAICSVLLCVYSFKCICDDIYFHSLTKSNKKKLLMKFYFHFNRLLVCVFCVCRRCCFYLLLLLLLLLLFYLFCLFSRFNANYLTLCFFFFNNISFFSVN